MEVVAVDIGGTHARFAIAEVEGGRVVSIGEPVTQKTAEDEDPRAEDLHPLDGVDAEIGFEIHRGVDHVDRVTGLVGHRLHLRDRANQTGRQTSLLQYLPCHG